MGNLGMVRGRFVISGLVVLCSLTMMLRRLLVVLRSLFVMLMNIVTTHCSLSPGLFASSISRIAGIGDAIATFRHHHADNLRPCDKNVSWSNSSRNASTVPVQSPKCCWRKSRAVGYQGLSRRSRSQRKSAANGSSSNNGLPIAPARCATAVSTETTASSCRDGGGGVGKIGKLLADLQHLDAAFQKLRILVTHIVLQADELHVGRRRASGYRRARRIERLRSLSCARSPDHAKPTSGRRFGSRCRQIAIALSGRRNIRNAKPE